MSRGRKPKPSSLKDLQGNPGKRKRNTVEPVFEVARSSDAPEWLDDLARQAWDLYAPELRAKKVLTAVDLHNLEAFCAAYSLWRKALAEIGSKGITVEGQTGPKKNPACTVANEALRQVQSFGALLGLDPSSRTRLMLPQDPKQKNPFALLMGGKSA